MYAANKTLFILFDAQKLKWKIYLVAFIGPQADGEY